MSIRTTFAIWAGKKTAWLSRVFGLGSGSSAPGMMALKFDKNIIGKLSSQIKKKKIIVSATNGKTTTAKMIAHIFAKNGMSFVRNSMGANLDRGIASALIQKSNWLGELRADYGIFEVDEAYLPQMIQKIKPDVIVLGNLFRDQLDRYGEIESLVKKWKLALSELDRPNSREKLPASSAGGRESHAKIILNADDPSVASLGEHLRNVYFYGIKDLKHEKEKRIEHAADSVRCVKCGNNLVYKNKYFSHLGDYVCLKCGYKRSKLDFWAEEIKTTGNSIQLLVISNTTKNQIAKSEKQKAIVHINLPGIYNIYNILAAQAVAKMCGIDLQQSAHSLTDFKPAFGRMEQFTYKERNFTISLIKNPTGSNAVIETIKNEKNKNIIMALNDKIADGTDVSWIYDTDFENLYDINYIVCAGTRAYDMALRLKYADITSELAQGNYIQIIDEAVKKTKKMDNIYIMPTYTAMLELRKELENKGIVNKI